MFHIACDAFLLHVVAYQDWLYVQQTRKALVSLGEAVATSMQRGLSRLARMFKTSVADVACDWSGGDVDMV